MKAIIFGANGQDGAYLSAACRERGVEVVGVSRSGDGARGDVSQYDDVERLVIAVQPDYLFHLAASSTTHHNALFENHASINTGTLNVLEAVRRHSPGAKVFITGSGLQFLNAGAPISERDPFHASSAYSSARIASVFTARYYRSLGIHAYIGYLFHHDSPLRKPEHISQKIAMAARRIAAGSDEFVELGDISVKKEWTFAADIAEAIWTFVCQDSVFEATIGSGIGHSIQEWLEQCFGLLGRDWRDSVQFKPGFSAEYKCLLSNPRTIKSLGWAPKVSFVQLATIMTASGEKA